MNIFLYLFDLFSIYMSLIALKLLKPKKLATMGWLRKLSEFII